MGRRITITAVVVFLAALFIAVAFRYWFPHGDESAADESALTYEQLMSRIRLIPIDEKAREFYDGGGSGFFGKSKTPEDPLLARVAKRRDFDHRKRYEDEILSFEYPDDSSITLEIKGPKDAMPISGFPVRSEGYSFSKAYRLAVGEHTYCLLMVEKTDLFDDSICFCGEEVFQKYLFHNGALYRFSFLAGGQVKKIQVLGDGVRVVLLEWTHSDMSQQVYVKTALSIRLKAPVSDQTAMMRRIGDAYGGIGFLELGMNRQQSVDLLGQPNQENETSLTYVQTDGRWRTTTTIPLRNGVFQGFGATWQKSEELPAERGTVDWIVDTVERKRDHRVFDPTVQPLPSNADVDYIFERFLEIGPKAKGDDWNLLCRAIYGLHKAGQVDKRVLPVVRKRFLEPGINQHYAAWLLDEYDSEGSRDLFAQRIRLTLNEARKRVGTKPEEDESPGFDPAGDLHNLLSFLGRSHPNYVPFILEAMDHPCADIRGNAYFFWDCLPKDKAKSYLLKGLEDTNDQVRQWASGAFAKSFGSKADIPVLRKRVAVESDEYTLNNLKTAISRLEALK